MKLAELVLTVTVTFSLTHRLCNSMPSAAKHHVNHKRLKHDRIRAIKQEILNKLGLTRVPDISKFNTTVEEKRKMLKLYRKSLEEIRGRTHNLFSEKEYYAKKFHSFSEDGSLPPNTYLNTWIDGSTPRYYFDVDLRNPIDPNTELYIYSAKLKLYKIAVNPHNFRKRASTDDNIRINLYQLLEPVQRGQRDTKKRLVDSKLVSLASRGWESFDIRQALQDWVDDPRKNYGIELNCDTQDLGDIVEFAAPNSRLSNEVFHAFLNKDLFPNLNVYTQERKIVTRVKRSDVFDECQRGLCCRRPLEVNFQDIGWDDWIIAPPKYEAYYCDGACPHNFKPAHTFALIKTALRMFNPAAAPAPCCSATRLSPLNLLHYDEDGNLVVSVHEDMVVEECKCA